MPHRNRVTPTGEVIAVPLRGAWTGNRGIIHDGTQIVRFHGGDHWVTCALRFKDRHEQQWLPRRLTWLFSHDEAVALAAGHRRRGECRHHEYGAYRDAWAAELHVDPPTAKQMNRTLHGERMVKGTRRRRFHEMDWNDLPDGTFVLANQVPALVSDSHLVEWTEEGYRTRRPRPVHGQAEVITPRRRSPYSATGTRYRSTRKRNRRARGDRRSACDVPADRSDETQSRGEDARRRNARAVRRLKHRQSHLPTSCVGDEIPHLTAPRTEGIVWTN